MNTLFKKAEQDRQKSRFKSAQKSYKSLLRKSLKPEEKAEALLGLADVERIQGYFTDSLQHYQAASKILKRLDPAARVDAHVGWALAARAVGRPHEALRELKKALVSYKKDKDPQGEAFAHWALGGTLRIAGDMKSGLKELQSALRMYKALKNPEGISYTYCALGGIFRMMGRYAESGKFYRKANHDMRHRGDTFGIAYSYCGLGNVQRMAGRFHQALPFYQKAEKLYRTIGDRVSYAYTLWSIGTTYKMLGDYTPAWKAFQKADALFRETGDTRGQIYTTIGFYEIRALSPNHRNKFNPGPELETNSNHSKVFIWESLHLKALNWLILWAVGKALMDANTKEMTSPKIKELKKAMADIIGDLALLYKKAGSKFYPKSLPVNWP